MNMHRCKETKETIKTKKQRTANLSNQSHIRLLSVCPPSCEQTNISEAWKIQRIRCVCQCSFFLFVCFFVFFIFLHLFLRQQFHISKLADRLCHTGCLDVVTDEKADVCCKAIWSLTVHFTRESLQPMVTCCTRMSWYDAVDCFIYTCLFAIFFFSPQCVQILKKTYPQNKDTTQHYYLFLIIKLKKSHYN